MERLSGMVKWFDEKKGFGFIDSEKKDYFVHFREIKNMGFKTLTQGQRVTFEWSKSDKGLTAKNVLVVSIEGNN